MLGLGLLLAAPAALRAHHSVTLYDTEKTVILSGTVSKIYWGNPHVYLHLLVGEEDGATDWTVEAGTPQLNSRHGWKYDDVKQGDKITVTLYPARDSTSRGSLKHIVLADGRNLEGSREFLKVPEAPSSAGK
jgi:hypothetical protein